MNSAAAAKGLTSQEAEARLNQFGPNDPAPPKRHSAVLDLLRLFLNPLTLILLIAAVISIFLGEATDAGIIITIVLLSTALDFTQTRKSHPRLPCCATGSGRKSGEAMSFPVT
jgi:Mg2+-importing ATPase